MVVKNKEYEKKEVADHHHTQHLLVSSLYRACMIIVLPFILYLLQT